MSDNEYWNGYQWRQHELDDLREESDAAGKHSERGVAHLLGGGADDESRLERDSAAAYESSGRDIAGSVVEKAADRPLEEQGPGGIVQGESPVASADLIPLTLRPERIVYAPNKFVPEEEDES